MKGLHDAEMCGTVWAAKRASDSHMVAETLNNPRQFRPAASVSSDGLAAVGDHKRPSGGTDADIHRRHSMNPVRTLAAIKRLDAQRARAAAWRARDDAEAREYQGEIPERFDEFTGGFGFDPYCPAKAPAVENILVPEWTEDGPPEVRVRAALTIDWTPETPSDGANQLRIAVGNAVADWLERKAGKDGPGRARVVEVDAATMRLVVENSAGAGASGPVAAGRGCARARGAWQHAL